MIFRWLAAVMLLEAFAHVACGAEACGVGNLRDAHLPFGDKGSRLSQTDIAYEDAWRFVEERRQFTVKSGAIHAEIRTETRHGISRACQDSVPPSQSPASRNHGLRLIALTRL